MKGCLMSGFWFTVGVIIIGLSIGVPLLALYFAGVAIGVKMPILFAVSVFVLICLITKI